MIEWFPMNLQERLDRYRERGMQEHDAQILVLIEESAAALFNSFPDHFILFGGVTLVLFHDSPRLSRDLDLLASPGQLPDPRKSNRSYARPYNLSLKLLASGNLNSEKT
jgi:Nucleotidyl transferase AbiEii toxin, Type IV TA system